MFQRTKVSAIHANYASQSDFCEVFEREMKSLYLLAFMLTANHRAAEQCFAATVADTSQAQPVFKGWVRSWVVRSMIKNAINIVSPAAVRNRREVESWGVDKDEPAEINAVTRLAPLDRFVFVMSVLERYSIRDCALLLDCSSTRVARSRSRALGRLPGTNNIFPADVTGNGVWSSGYVGATA